ncbi:response regulator transcription factor [Streptosporangium sp. NPDC049376]|uniref:response regulator transcription factor n=1 Tax=Streptosporangium sp. NPDC049376 TaxID=3366192 RepID=UPI0037A5301E
MRVLMVEDERVLADYVADGLRGENMTVDVAYDGTDALRRLARSDYDVVILDRGLPGVSGDQVCEELTREGGRTRVLMLTAAGSVRDRLQGFSLGADDYLPKPFDYSELLARVSALGRRTGTALPPVLRCGGLTLDTSRLQASREGVPLALSPKEFAVLEVLMSAQGRVVSAEELLERAWDENADPFTSAVRVVMAKLRAKLGDPPVIETVLGTGYRI